MNSCILLSVRKNVDFPQPDGPISAVTVPAAKSNVTSLRACFAPNQACTPRASSPEPSGAVPGFLVWRADATSASE